MACGMPGGSSQDVLPPAGALAEEAVHLDPRCQSGTSLLRRLFVLWRICFFPVFSSLNVVGFFLLALPVISAYLTTVFVHIPSHLQDNIREYDYSGFKSSVLLLVVNVLSLTVINGTSTYLQNVFRVLCRGKITRQLQKVYLSDQVYYRISSRMIPLDNPDQRIVRDIDLFVTSVTGIVFSIWSCLATIVGMTAVLVEKLSWYGFIPAMFLFIGVTVGVSIIRPIVRMVFLQERLEGNFRFAHLRVREWAEELGFLRGDSRERGYLSYFLARALQNQKSIFFRLWPVYLWVELFGFLRYVTGFVIPGLLLFWVQRGTSSSDVLTSGMATIQIMADLKTLVRISQELPLLAGYASRISEILEISPSDASIRRRRGERRPSEENESLLNGFVPFDGRVVISEDSAISFENVLAATFAGDILVRDLSFIVESGERLLIQGPNGCGKSSLLRLLHGLWPIGSGVIYRPEKVLSLPQTPHLSFGTLGDQVVYPETVFSLTANAANASLRLMKEGGRGTPSVNSDAWTSTSTGTLGSLESSQPRSLFFRSTESSSGRANDLREASEQWGIHPVVARYIVPVSKGEDKVSVRRRIFRLICDDVRSILTYCLLEDKVDDISKPNVEWMNILSHGQKQLLMFARLFFHHYALQPGFPPMGSDLRGVTMFRPTFATLDESTSALPPFAESKMFDVLWRSRISFISVGHRDHLRKYHDRVLRLALGVEGTEWVLERSMENLVVPE